ncbi:PREDICTED: serine/threonine-protein phosphatase 4 regulatory subunit 4-like [Ceratosolen solmsi marchali]|uniref:Serine/threonine-protein phosphatase 4 regulatory subunit 4-like n=1 Tax=Ceratosolen solmsi marchali TaxID=326594 RepID=A0AAJ6VKV1_9HYME|nr:PREDICTED: serine/threonine-protein phosphatase 4 regulatory subunit 4-like [Ceratosolen solmsi marchali]
MWQPEAEPPFQSPFIEIGDDVQKLSVIESLPQLLAEDAHACITRVVPKIQQSLSTASPEFHMAAAVIYKQVLEQRLVSHLTFTEVFLQSILSSLDSREPAISHAWLETVVDVIELLPVDVIRREILPIAIKEGRILEIVNSRLTCCRLIGKIATRFDSVSVQKEILPMVQSLCQDINKDVRACMCLQLRHVGQNMGSNIMKLLPFLIELANDEESNVRQAAVQTIGHLLPQLQPDTIKDVMIPLMKTACENAVKKEDDVVGVIAQEIGKLAQHSETHLTPAEKTWFLKYFIQLARMGTAVISADKTKQDFSFNIDNNIQTSDKTIEYRQNCAFNIPAMFLFALSVPDGIHTLIPTFQNLANDSHYTVRRTIACSLHEIVKVLGSKSGLIKMELLNLLKDSHEEVLESLIPHISEILDRLLQNHLIGVDNTESLTIDLGRALVKCEVKISATYNWRLSVLMLNQFETLPKYFPNDFIYTYLVPIVKSRILRSRPLPIRMAAGRSLLVFLRYNINFQQRIEIRNQLCNDIAHSPNCYVRMLFIRIMIEGLTIFSSMYFKEHFCSTLLSLMDDPVANVRLKIVALVPIIKSCLRLPADKKLLSSLETNIRNLVSNEKDRDVSAALTDVTDQMESIEVRIDSQPSPTKLSRYDSDDMKKYEEEKKIDGMLNSKSSTNTNTVMKKRLIVKKFAASQVFHIYFQISASDYRPTSTMSRSPVKSSSSKGGSHANKEFSKSSSAKPPLVRQNALSSQQSNQRMHEQSKSSTSTDNLTSNWSRFTSNNSQLKPSWDRMASFSHNTNLTSTNPCYQSSNEYSTQRVQCSCYELADRIFRRQALSSDLIQQSSFSNLSDCPYLNGSNNFKATNPLHPKHDYKFSNLSKPPLITNIRDDKHDIWQDLMLTRSSFDSKYSMPNLGQFQSHYNPYWTFSSMPKIPVTLVDDEFMVDAGIRIPTQLTSSQSASKIPNLQDIIYRNKKVSNTDRIRRCGSTYEKSKPTNFGLPKRYSVDYENSGKTLLMPPPPASSSSASSMSSSTRDSKYCQSGVEDRQGQAGAGLQGRARFGFETNERKLLEDKSKRGGPSIVDKDRGKLHHTKSVAEKSKRHSTSYNSKLPDTKDVRPKFKRYSMEVADYSPTAERNTDGRVLRRLSILDVNHNQGLSKIPVRNIHSSGSRTAPGTRTSSPIRVDSELYDKPGYCSAPAFSQDRRLRRYRSSDEEVEKLCQKF